MRPNPPLELAGAGRASTLWTTGAVVEQRKE
jgi:hypothetical protein